jgi:DNA invertase Pin-like site-specific DNA recombinase
VRAVIYARRSVEQRDRAEESKIVTPQVKNTRAFAAKRGRTVLEEHIYIDDRISGGVREAPRLHG